MLHVLILNTIFNPHKDSKSGGVRTLRHWQTCNLSCLKAKFSIIQTMEKVNINDGGAVTAGKKIGGRIGRRKKKY